MLRKIGAPFITFGVLTLSGCGDVTLADMNLFGENPIAHLTPERVGATPATYRAYDCNFLASNIQAFQQKMAADSDKRVWQWHIDAMNQVRAEKNCSAISARPVVTPTTMNATPALATTAGQATIGVRLDAVTTSVATALGLDSSKGALVIEVVKGTPAEKAGIKPMDVILGIDNQDIASPEELVAAVQRTRVGSRMKLQVWCNRVSKTYVLTTVKASQVAVSPAPSNASNKPHSIASSTGVNNKWGLVDEDMSILIGADLMKKAHMAERRPDILAAAQAGDMLSQYLIGASYDYTYDGIGPDAVQKVTWLTKAADQGMVRAVAVLGVCRIAGTGTPQDDLSGWALLMKAVNANNAFAQYIAAMFTLRGVDAGGGRVRQFSFFSKPDARAMLQRSAAAGLSAAQYSLGHSFMVGSELNKVDLAQARHWLSLAAAQNNIEAKNDLAGIPPN
jgi:hypothetical protein